MAKIICLIDRYATKATLLLAWTSKGEQKIGEIKMPEQLEKIFPYSHNPEVTKKIQKTFRNYISLHHDILKALIDPNSIKLDALKKLCIPDPNDFFIEFYHEGEIDRRCENSGMIGFYEHENTNYHRTTHKQLTVKLQLLGDEQVGYDYANSRFPFSLFYYTNPSAWGSGAKKGMEIAQEEIERENAQNEYKKKFSPNP